MSLCLSYFPPPAHAPAIHFPYQGSLMMMVLFAFSAPVLFNWVLHTLESSENERLLSRSLFFDNNLPAQWLRKHGAVHNPNVRHTHYLISAMPIFLCSILYLLTVKCSFASFNTVIVITPLELVQWVHLNSFIKGKQGKCTPYKL